MGKTYVLVHGGFHGGWCWKEVATLLRNLGHVVYTPTLTGLGERSHLLSFRPTLKTFIEDIVQVIRYEELKDVILVGHGFAGSVVSGVADRIAQQLKHLVYLNSNLLQSGEASVDRSPERIAHLKERALQTSDGLGIPPGNPEYFGITDPTMAAWLLAKLTPHPVQTYFDRLELTHPLGNGVRATYIEFTQPRFPTNERSRELAKQMPGWAYLELATGHDGMLLKPRELTDMLAKID